MKWILCILALLMSPSFAHAQSQTPGSPKAEVKLTVGWYGFDEDAHPAIGGAFAYYPAQQANVELEGLYLLPRRSETYGEFRGFALTPSFGVDFRRPRVNFQPFGRIAYSIDHTSSLPRANQNSQTARREGSTNGSLGVRLGFKFYIGDRFFVYPEIGMGENLNVKATLSGGYVTSRF